MINFTVQHIVEQSRQVMSMLTTNNYVVLATPYNAECFTQTFSFIPGGADPPRDGALDAIWVGLDKLC